MCAIGIVPTIEAIKSSSPQGSKKLGKTIVLPEGEDKRVVEAACQVVKQGVAKIILLGNEEEIKKAKELQRLKEIEE